jgi:predicted RNA-binding protein with PUA-like domain
MSYWLAKSEPEVFSIQDLEKAKKKTTRWDGVRNYQARNSLRAMKKGDHVLFYHSSADPPGVAGIARVVKEAYGDPTALDEKSEYHDPKATKDDPIWSVVDVKHDETFAHFVSLDELRATKELSGLGVLKRGNRLSVMPVTEREFERIRDLGRKR